MADLTKSLLDAISIIATKSADEVSSDKTIKATVKKVVSTSEGKYLVSYNDGSFYAYIQPGSTDLYQVDEQIYILVPAGDMSQKKFIIGKVGEVEERSSSKILASSLLNDYVMIGENAVIENTYKENEADIHVKRMQPLALNSHKINDFYYCYLYNPDEVNSLLESKGISTGHNYNTFAYPCLDIDNEVFSNSVKQAEALLIRAKFKTSIDTNTIGNYGIIVNIAFADETNPQTDDDGNIIIDTNGNAVYTPKTIAYVLDTSKMTGNPMKFYDYTSQYMIAAFNGEKYLYIDSIVAFSEGFVSEDTEAHNNIDDVNIYIDGLEIIALDEISAVNGDYKLKLIAPRGNTIRAGQKDSLKIAAEVTYLNQDISKNTDFYWGVKDPSIVSTSDNYNAKLGSGYRYLENENKKELILSSGSLTAAENIYICVAVYESNIILKTSISLYNNNNKLNITIDSDQGTSFQFNEGNPILTCLINGKDHNYQDNNPPDDAFSFIWSKEDEELGTIILNKTKAQLEADRDRELQECQANTSNHLSSAGRSILEVTSYYSTQIAQIKDVSYPQGPRGPKINCKLKNVNTYVIYSCSVYRGGIYVGYASITLQNSRKVINNNYYVTITNGSQVFQYDEGGVAPNSQKNQEPIDVLDLTAVFHSPQGAEVTPKKVRWIVPEGKTLIKIPRLGLKVDPETGEKYFSGNTYPLNIKDIYDSNCNDNQLIAIVTHNDGTEYRQSTNLLFTKIGEIGTNGTNTTVKIDELPNVPKEECLTIIKDVVNEENRIFYNGYKSDINTELTSSNNPVLKASLYTNNSEVLGYSTKWTIAGTSKTYGKNYEVSANSDDGNQCIINYNNHNSELDTRIIRAQINFGGKYFYSFYGLPAIEYSDGYNYKDYPIKIMRDGTLRTVLYDSGGTNPTYTTGCGVHVELPENSNTIGFLDWEIEDGANFSLAKSPKLKQGSEKLEISTEVESIKQAVKTAHDTGVICADGAPADIKEYINEFLTDIERTCLDSILSVSSKLESLWNRLAVFESESPDKTNIAIKTVYGEYLLLFDKMQKEYDDCAGKNENYVKEYTAVQNIWNSEWPEVIFGTRLHISGSGSSNENIDTIQELIDRYKQAYNHRLDDNTDINYSVDRNNLFDESFISILNNKYNWSFDDYDPILDEYVKVLIAYIDVLINETKTATGPLNNRYKVIYDEWDNNNNKNVKKYIEDILKSCKDNISNIYDSVRDLYNYYQGLFLNVKRNKIAQDSETLNIWNATLRNQNPDLLNQIYVIPNDNFNGLRMNNNVIGTVYTENNNERSEIAKIYVPIIMTLNTYELAALNGWDGTNVEIGDDHIMTPQIGAGIKDDTTNTFTGMAMGVIGSTVESKDNETIFDKVNKTNRIGLIGYCNGQQSMFIDAKTGKATFGLPSEDNGFDEGRIELNPGGVSKIGNWKIGNRFLYNIVDGTYELRKDIDASPSHKESKIMVPHDKYGIVLSSDQPYIHVKGEVYEDKNLISINYADEYNNINPGDSLELRMDPGNKSLFSIVQHTEGFGDEDTEGLFFGYKSTESDENITVVKNYIANKNIAEYNEIGQTGINSEYYIYELAEDKKPFYDVETVLCNLNLDSSNDIVKIKDENNLYVYRTKEICGGTEKLSTVLDWNNFVKTTSNNDGGPVFSINNNTGVITYNSKNLIWKNVSQKDDWQSAAEEIETSEDFSVDFKYSKKVDSIKDQNINVGSFTIDSNIISKIYQIQIKNCTLCKELTGINFDSSENNYIRFYVVPDDQFSEEEILLASKEINIWNDLNNVDIELSSYNNNYLLSNNLYYLIMKIHLDSYNISADCSCDIGSNMSSTERILSEDPLYGTVEITNKLISGQYYGDFSLTNNLLGKYRYYKDNNNNEYNLQIAVFKPNLNSNDSDYEIKKQYFDSLPSGYDFVVWRKSDDKPLTGGRVKVGERWGLNPYPWAKFFTTKDTEWEKLNVNIWLEVLATQSNPIYISFYPEGYLTEENIEYVFGETGETGDGTSGVTEDVITLNIEINSSTNEKIITESSSLERTKTSDEETISESTIQTITSIITYKFINENILSMEPKIVYESINWKNWNSQNYNNIGINWKLLFKNLFFGEIVGFLPTENYLSTLCIREDGNNLQGKPLAKTYWTEDDNNIVQKIRFYQKYYFETGNKSNHKRKQYGYIDIDKNNIDENSDDVIYYKYIKTIPKNNIIDSWFKNENLSEGYHSSTNSGDSTNDTFCWDWIDIPITVLEKINNWKEFIRVGLDENGRFFSAGLQDKRTYSRTGKIYSFGKVPNLYGQEIKTESSNNNYNNIIKIFSQIPDLNTTYITQGKNDNGNISIRTSGNNHYVELAASKSSANELNIIPDKTSYIQVGYNGIDIQADDGNSLINLKNGLAIMTNSMLIQNTSFNNKTIIPDFKFEINSDHSYIKSPFYIISSLNSPNNVITENDYIVRMFKNNPTIEMEVGKNDSRISLTSNKVLLKASRGRYLEINNINDENTISIFNIDNMRLSFDSNNKSILLKNGNRNYIEIDSNNILLQVGQSKVSIADEIILKGRQRILVESSSFFNRDVCVKSDLYSGKNLHVGYNNKENQSTAGIIYLYEDNKEHKLKISAKDLKQLFDWYNNYRWAIGCYGNTVILRNVKGSDSPEGEWERTSTTINEQEIYTYKYKWNFKTFRDYYQ